MEAHCHNLDPFPPGSCPWRAPLVPHSCHHFPLSGHLSTSHTAPCPISQPYPLNSPNLGLYPYQTLFYPIVFTSLSILLACFFLGTVSRSTHRGPPHLVGPDQVSPCRVGKYPSFALVRLIRCCFPRWLACDPGYDRLGNMLASDVNISAPSGPLYSF